MSTPRRPEPRSSAAPMTATERPKASTDTAASAYAGELSARHERRRREAGDLRRRKDRLAQLPVHRRTGERDDRDWPPAHPRGRHVVADEGADLAVGHPVETHRPGVEAHRARPGLAGVARADEGDVRGRAGEPEAAAVRRHRVVDDAELRLRAR